MHSFPLLAFTVLSTVSPTDLAAVITALGGIIIGVLAARRSSKTDKATQEQAQRNSLLEGYGQIVKDLQREIERIRAQYQADLDRWTTEKVELEKERRIFLNQLELLHDQSVKAKRIVRKKVTVNEESDTD